VLAVEYDGRSDSAAAYLYEGEGANAEATYVDAEGHPLDGAPLRFPLEFTRITSAFSDARLHPILHVNRPHLGVDFAAPVGTPVRAIGPGAVQFSGVQGGFGNHVELDHGDGFVSAYSHLQRIAPGLAPGAAVKRGQLVGWVGQTGLASGPHLHFAIFQDGEYLDPLAIRYPPQLGAVDEAAFARLRRTMSARLHALPQSSPAAPTAPDIGLPPLAQMASVGPITLTF
jgi:murein DD-endopeptidase MepM/ murein hydrolase activator NlpD